MYMFTYRNCLNKNISVLRQTCILFYVFTIIIKIRNNEESSENAKPRFYQSTSQWNTASTNFKNENFYWECNEITEIWSAESAEFFKTLLNLYGKYYSKKISAKRTNFVTYSPNPQIFFAFIFYSIILH